MTPLRKFVTEDGYTFYVQPNGIVTDQPDPTLADMTYRTLDEFLTANPTAKENLGPVPTVKQMEWLKKIAQPEATVQWYSGIRGPDSAAIIYDKDVNKRESFRTDLLHKFRDWGWIVAFGDPAWAWRNNEYRITEKGRKVVELGKVRK